MASKKGAILVVDDDVFVRAYTREILQQQGYQVLEAVDADEALAHATEHSVTAVITDLEMPGSETGLGLGRRLREQIPGVAIIYVSGNDAELDTPFLKTGVNFLRKPYDPEQLVAVLERALAAI